MDRDMGKEMGKTGREADGEGSWTGERE